VSERNHPDPIGSTRFRVSWSPRGERPWCPGATRPAPEAQASAPTGWTAFFRVQGVVDLLRERLAREPAAPLPRGVVPWGPEERRLLEELRTQSPPGSGAAAAPQSGSEPGP
jgi:hypothetical protein